jgi:prepilin-type N-terminal cleavage/methylation domain-containing protein
MRATRRTGLARRRHRGVTTGFTLVELLVVIAIMAVLIGLLIPAVQAAREAARRAVCADRQKQVAYAIRQYEAARSAFPPGRIGCDDTGEIMSIPLCPPGLPPEQKNAASGFVAILPHIEQQPLHDQLAVASGGLWNRNVSSLAWYDIPAKRDGVQQRLALFTCPSDTASPLSDVYAPIIAATASFALVQGSIGPGHLAYTKSAAKYDNDGLFIYVRPRHEREVTDGLSHTLALGEVILGDWWESSNTWTYARQNADSLRTTANPLNTRPGDGALADRQNGAFASHHPGGATFAHADAHVTFLQEEIDLALYRALSTIAGDDN